MSCNEPVILEGSYQNLCPALIKKVKCYKNLLGVCLSWEKKSQNESTTSKAVSLETAVYAGCPSPLVRNIYRNENNTCIPETGWKTEPEHAVRFLVDSCRNSNRKIGLLILGPLTDLAMALRIAPDIASGIRQIIFLGGATPCSDSEYAEQNVMMDPEAAEIVFRSGIPVILLPGSVIPEDISPEEAAVQCLIEPNTVLASRKSDCSVSLDRGIFAGALLEKKQSISACGITIAQKLSADISGNSYR